LKDGREVDAQLRLWHCCCWWW